MEKTPHSTVLGAGPIGRAIAAALASQGRPVTVVTRDGRAIGPGIATARADLADAEQTRKATEGSDAIYFCAAPAYHKWLEAFPALQASALAAAQSSGAVLVAVENLYGYGAAGTVTEEMPLAATTRKGRLRATLSEQLSEAHASGRAQYVSGRATDFFGPGVTMSALGDRVWPSLLSGQTVQWVGDPDAPHSFAYLPDLARAYVALADDPSSWGRAWHLPALPPLSLREICDRVRPGVRIRSTPSWLLRIVGLMQPAAGELVEMRYMFDAPLIIDHTRFDQAFGLRQTSWPEAIAETSEWWKKGQNGTP